MELSKDSFVHVLETLINRAKEDKIIITEITINTPLECGGGSIFINFNKAEGDKK